MVNKLNHSSIKHRNFYNSLKKKKLSRKEYEKFTKEFCKRDSVTMHDWLKEYNIADVEPFIKDVDKTRHQYFLDKLNMLKNAVSIAGILQWYVLNKALKKRPECNLYAPEEPCKHTCKETCTKQNCKACKEVRKECKKCPKNQAYELLKTDMVGDPAIAFCSYHERGKSRIKSHIYGQKGKVCKKILGYNANTLYLYCSGHLMPLGKQKLIKVQNPRSQLNIERFNKKFLFGFA